MLSIPKLATILSVPFCPMTFCTYTILSIPFCPYTILSVTFSASKRYFKIVCLTLNSLNYIKSREWILGNLHSYSYNQSVCPNHVEKIIIEANENSYKCTLSRRHEVEKNVLTSWSRFTSSSGRKHFDIETLSGHAFYWKKSAETRAT